MTNIITTTEGSYLGLAFRANLEKNPDLMKFDVEQFEEDQQKHRAAMNAANPPKIEPVRVEFNRLRGQLFDHQQHAKAMEIRVNNEAGNVHEFERRITAVLKLKKEHEDAGNLLGARSYEHQAQQLENELADARDRLVKDQRYNAAAARGLREWQQEHGPRLKELQKEVAKLPENNADTHAKELEGSFRK